MAMRQKYMAELEAMNQDVIRMSTCIEEAIEKSVTVLKTMDLKEANKIIVNDDIIDEMEREIRRECIRILAKQQPVAKDLRRVTAILRMISDIERIADHCADISEYVILLAKEDKLPMPDKIDDMFMKMKEMVVGAIDSFVSEDVDKAGFVQKSDQVVDDYFDNILNELCEEMKHHPENLKSYVYYVMIIKYVERMADHATNMAEWNMYMITGEMET